MKRVSNAVKNLGFGQYSDEILNWLAVALIFLLIVMSMLAAPPYPADSDVKEIVWPVG
jgi:hypothetical protein